MNEQLLILSWLLPLLVAPLALFNRHWPASLAAVPALITAFFVPAGTVVQIPWLFLGSHFGLDHNASIFLMFSAVIWFVAGLQAELTMRNAPLWARFRFFFLLAMSGNFWLILSQDMVNFYLGFSLMGLSAYALVIHSATSKSLFAGRVYLIMTLLAESALLAGFLFIYSHTGSLAPAAGQLAGISNWAIGFLILGLGIKAGLVFLHVWLPLTYTAAPIPASAVLSGAMINVALLGWIRYLPVGQETLPEWGSLLVIAGTASIVFGAVAGLVQSKAKTVLAYSSISKMGFMTSLIGLAMLAPEQSEYIVMAVVFLAAYHGLAKSALFLGIGIVKAINSKLTFMLLLLPALVLAAAPFTAGSMMKTVIRPVIDNWQGEWIHVLPILLLTSSFATAMLMVRFLVIMSVELSLRPKKSFSIALPWVCLVALLIFVPFLLDHSFSPVIDSWPLAAVITGSLLLLYIRPPWMYSLPGLIPAGDLLFPMMTLGASARLYIRAFTCRVNSKIKTLICQLNNNFRNLIRFALSLTGGKS
ncbi:MAG: NADH/ubiquinone/plastoquinone (complex I) [Gammaproteobacteria bacterium]|jgi:formate hydrogenlyase subunit 3/multisubunit Na+/H+ antiporter MnhD subunit|nr:NADH/ubiquinone/plastoquinone (complex I) [Gammaproteobacteria bacterium]